MTDINIIDFLVAGMATYGSIALGLALLVGALGIPLPTTFLVVAAGASAQQGVIDWAPALALGLLGAVLGDNASYGMGRLAKDQAVSHAGQSSVWRMAQTKFEQYGAWTVYLTRFLLTPLAIPTNLIAGGSGYDFRQFFAYDLAGELTWLLLYGGLGYVFGSQWELIVEVISDYSGWLGGGVVASLGIYWFVRYYWQGHGSGHKYQIAQ